MSNIYNACILFDDLFRSIKQNKKNIIIDIRKAKELKGILQSMPPYFLNLSWIEIFNFDWSAHVIKYFDRLGLVEIFFYDVFNLKEVPQDKKDVFDAFDHTLKVLNEVDKLFPNDRDMKLAALYHDTGKFDTWLQCKNFYEHELYSVKRFNSMCNQLGGEQNYPHPIVKNYDRVSNIILNHMRPLQYQRNPNWTDSAVCRFDKRCNGYTEDVINFAICDKLAHHSSYIDELHELMDRVLKLRRGENA